MGDLSKASSALLLEDLMRQVRRELLEAVAEREALGAAPIIELKNVALEVNFVVETEEKAEAGVKATLLAVAGLKAGAPHRYSSEQVHKITLELSALAPVRAIGMRPRERRPIQLEVDLDEHPVLDSLIERGAGAGGGIPLAFEPVHITGFGRDPTKRIAFKGLWSGINKRLETGATGGDAAVDFDVADLLGGSGSGTE